MDKCWKVMWKNVNNVEKICGKMLINFGKSRKIQFWKMVKNGKIIPEKSDFEKSLFFDNKIPISFTVSIR